VLGTESDLLDFGKVVDRVSVEGKSTDVLDRDKILWDDLGGIEQIKVELSGMSAGATRLSEK
jgi:hypothetical protein